MSFRLKTILGVALIEVVLLLVLVWNSLAIIKESHEEELAEQATLSANLLTSATRNALISRDLETLDQIGKEVAQSPLIAGVRIKDSEGRDLFNYANADQADQPIQETREVIVAGQTFGQLEISYSRAFVDEVMDGARREMILIASLEVMLVGLFSFMLGTYLTRQLNRMQVAAQAISEGALGTTVDITSDDELGKTAEGFNRMSRQVKDLYDRTHSSEKRMRAVLETVADGIITIDTRGLIVSANPAVNRIFGYDDEDLRGRNVSMLMDGQDREAHDGYISRHLETGDTQVIGNRRRVMGRSRRGDIFPVELSVQKVELTGETLFVGTLRDLREQEQNIALARSAQQQLAEAIESSADGFVIYDSEDRLVICNQRYREIYSASADLLVPGNTFEHIIREGVRRGQYQEAVGNEESWIAQRLHAHNNPSGPVEQRLEDGHWIRVWENKTQSGSIVGFRIDITELKEREEALKASQARLKATMVSALDCIVCIDAQSRITEFNPAAEKTFGFQKKDVLGQDMAELLIPPGMRDAHRKGMAHYMATGEGPVLGKRIELTALRKNGEEFPIEVALEVAQDNAGGTMFVAYMRDITDQKAHQEEMVVARQRAEAANEAKAGFLATMSHEIRTPLNGVLGVLGLLEDTALTQQQKDYIQTARESGDALLTIINDILDFSKMEAGKFQLEETEVELKPMLESIFSLLGPQAGGKGLSLVSKIDDDVPWSIITDGGRLRQILLNLMSNAIKFTHHGAVSVMVSAPSHPEGTSLVRFDVMDTGIGIPASLQSDLFAEFTTIDASYARKFGGTGLGLAICRKLVELMGGRIGFSSTEGEGSVFWFEVEAPRGELLEGPGPREDHVEPSGRPLNVLVAEDHSTNLMIVKKILEKQGHTVFVATNGIEAVEAVRRFPVEIVLMDGSMPEMDGMEATRHIRALDHARRDIPIIALTAHAMKGDRTRFIDSGMNDYLVKPISRDAILTCLAKWASETPRAGDETGAPPDEQHQASPLLDVSCLEQLAADTSQELLPVLIQTFVDDAKTRLKDVEQALKDQTFEVIELNAHALASSAASFGLMRFNKAALELEVASAKDAARHHIAPLVTDFLTVARASLAELERQIT